MEETLPVPAAEPDVRAGGQLGHHGRVGVEVVHRLRVDRVQDGPVVPGQPEQGVVVPEQHVQQASVVRHAHHHVGEAGDEVVAEDPFVGATDLPGSDQPWQLGQERAALEENPHSGVEERHLPHPGVGHGGAREHLAYVGRRRPDDGGLPGEEEAQGRVPQCRPQQVRGEQG
ncbi:hypothetical protein ACE1SV_68770 [Streptomyces sp. E-15]